jgi:hypothetical protein
MYKIGKLHRVSQLAAAASVVFMVSAPFAAAYVATEKSEVQAEKTSSQFDRSKKGDLLRVSPYQKPVEGGGAKQIEAPKPIASPRMLA